MTTTAHDHDDDHDASKDDLAGQVAPYTTLEDEGPDDLDEFMADLMADPREREAARDAEELLHLMEALRAIRKAVGLSQKAVAEHMGTKQSAVSVLEGGASDPQLTTLLKYARAVGVRLPLRPVLPGEGRRLTAPEPRSWLHQSSGRAAQRPSRVRRLDDSGVVVAPREWGRAAS